jgi:hypothetical protein
MNGAINASSVNITSISSPPVVRRLLGENILAMKSQILHSADHLSVVMPISNDIASAATLRAAGGSRELKGVHVEDVGAVISWSITLSMQQYSKAFNASISGTESNITVSGVYEDAVSSYLSAIAGENGTMSSLLRELDPATYQTATVLSFAVDPLSIVIFDRLPTLAPISSPITMPPTMMPSTALATLIPTASAPTTLAPTPIPSEASTWSPTTVPLMLDNPSASRKQHYSSVSTGALGASFGGVGLLLVLVTFAYYRHRHLKKQEDPKKASKATEIQTSSVKKIDGSSKVNLSPSAFSSASCICC